MRNRAVHIRRMLNAGGTPRDRQESFCGPEEGVVGNGRNDATIKNSRLS